jgi:3-(3-hydroxy-phenyl)propionate hydroxylase
VRGFQRIGLGQELSDLLQPARPGDRIGFANSKREWLFGQDIEDFGSNGWQPLSAFHQPEVDAYLRKTAAEHPNVTAYIGCDVDRFEDTGEVVEVFARESPSDTVVEASARYLVACDGANSGTRRALGIGWHDLGYDHDWLVVDVIAKDGNTLGSDSVQVCDPDRLVTYVVTKDPYRRWEFKLNPGETAAEMLDRQKIFELIEPWTPRDTVFLLRSAVYQFHAATADAWRAGRILLAGDAAHQTPPFLGQGMNAGIRDVINLAWKLPLVVSGVAPDTLLDDYMAERSAHATDLVEWAVAVGQLMEHVAAVEAAERAGDPPPPEPPGKRASGYGQGREAPPLRGGVILLDQVSDSGSTGYLFRQPIVSDAAGNEFRLDERLGAGFAIVARSEADLALDARSRALVERLGIATTSLEGLTPVRGSFDGLFDHAAAAIVRPDRYVFGHTTDALSLDALLAELETRLRLS